MDTGPAPPRPRLPPAGVQRPRPVRVERAAEPGGGGARRRGPRRRLGGVQPTPRGRHVRPPHRHRRPRTRPLRRRADAAGAARRPVRRRRAEHRPGTRPARRDLRVVGVRRRSSPGLGRASGIAAADEPRFARRTCAPAAPAVQHLPVHQRRGVADGRDAAGSGLRGRHLDLRRARRDVRAEPCAGGHPRRDELRLVGRGAVPSGGHARRRPPRPCDGRGAGRPTDVAPALQHRPRRPVRTGVADLAGHGRPDALLRRVRSVRHHRADRPGLDHARRRDGPRPLRPRRSRPGDLRATAAGVALPRRLLRDVLHRGAHDRRHLPIGVLERRRARDP